MRLRHFLSCTVSAFLATGVSGVAQAADHEDKGWPAALPETTALIASGTGAGCQFYADPNAKELARYKAGDDPASKGTQNDNYTGMRYPGGTAFSATDFLFSTILPGERPFINPLDATTGEARAGGPNDFEHDPSARPLGVMYQNFDILDCNARLRQYVLGETTDTGVTYPQKDVPFGPTFSFAPDTSLHLDIVNRLPEDDPSAEALHADHGGHSGHDISVANSHGGHPAQSSPAGYVAPFMPDDSGVPAPFGGTVHNLIHDLNHTNIHTHGFHVDPTGNSDNVFVNITPGGADATADTCRNAPNKSCHHEQLVTLPSDHPGGTFWYHAHLHGATAVQVSSGMAGGLVVRDARGKGLDAAPSVAGAIDMFLGLQQMPYDDQGQVEGIYFVQEARAQTNSTCDTGAQLANRPRLINGVSVPTINVKLNQTYRLRFLHSGSIGQIKPQVVTQTSTGLSALNDVRSDGGSIDAMTAAPVPGEADYAAKLAAYNKKYFVPLNEIETDGLPTGGIVAKPQIELAPAYRSAALFYVTDEMLQGLSGVEHDPATDTYTLYLIDQTQSPTGAATQCLRDSAGKLVLDSSGAPVPIQVTIANLRRVMAVIKVDASDPVELECCEPTSQFAAAQETYTSPPWDAANAFNPAAKYGYEGIGPLAPIHEDELRASAERAFDYRRESGAMVVDEPIAMVHYYGDGPKPNSAWDSLYNATSGSSYTDYACADTGGACTYCGGTKGLVVLPNGDTFLANLERNDEKVCGPVKDSKAIAQPTEASMSAYAAPNRLPWINFMICTRPTTTDLRPALSSDMIAQLEDAVIKGDKPPQFIFNSKTGKAEDPELQADVILAMLGTLDDLEVVVWQCMKFNEASEFTRWMTLNSSNQWRVSSKGNGKHVFHIHVNPFTLEEPYATAGTLDFDGQSVPPLNIWKDTLLAPPLGSNPVNFEGGALLKTRYTVFPGAFVQHCHVLTHEDQGMMQVVSVADGGYVEQLRALVGAETEFEMRQVLSAELMSAVAEDDRKAGPALLELIDVMPPPAE